jgi:hypothetical protein
MDDIPVPATREKPVSNDWLFAFPEALIACFQKQMEMQKDSAFSAWLFLVKLPPLRPSEMKWRKFVSPLLKRKAQSVKISAFSFFPHSHSHSHTCICAFL